MRIGLIGTGRIGSFHAGVLARHPAVASLVVTDMDPVRAGEAAARTGATAVASAEEVIGAGVDAVVITSATSAHAELIGRAARAGLPAFCEKPIALDLAGTLGALHEVERAGSVLQLGFMRRFDAGTRPRAPPCAAEPWAGSTPYGRRRPTPLPAGRVSAALRGPVQGLPGARLRHPALGDGP